MIRVITKTHALCPHCGFLAATIDHAIRGWFPPWLCDNCCKWYEVRKHGDTFEVRKSEGKEPWPWYWVLLQNGDIRILLKRQRCASWDESTDEYHYNEGTCPINYLSGIECIADGYNVDPHGVFEFVKTWPWKDGDDADEIMTKIIEEAKK